MGIELSDILIFFAVILGFVFVSIFIISGLTDGWKQALPSALHGLGGWILLGIAFTLIGFAISLLRGCFQ